MKESKKKPNIIIFTIFMIIVFLIITELIIYGFGSNLLIYSIMNYSNGTLVISEAVLALLVLIVMLIFKNSYVFTQKHEKLSKGLFYGLYYIIGSLIFLLIMGLFAGGFKGGLAILNVLIGCFLVGITEEFLCRGWLLNEFLERFGESKKGIWYSIVISGLIFGMLHISNIFTAHQDIASTIVQAISAAGTGIIFGIIYYKVKNIWSVVLLHGLWDFSIFLGQIAPVTSTVEVTTNITIVGIICSIIMFVAEMLNIIPYVKDIKKEPKKSTVVLSAAFGISLYLASVIILAISNFDFGDTYEFSNINIENYAITKDNYSEYYINNTNIYGENFNFKLAKDKNNLILTNLNTNYSIIFECKNLNDYIIMENDNNYIIAYNDNIDSNNSYLYYVYVNKNELNNSNDFINAIKNNLKKYLLSDVSDLVILHDQKNNQSYLTAYNIDYGYYLLIDENKMAILNRDK